MNNIIRLLYVEDNPQDADLTRAHFQRVAPDFYLEIVASGSACLERLSEQSFDLLLIDNLLPDMYGLDVIGRLRADRSELPVVLITGVGNEEIVAKALRAGAADYVSKSEINYLAKLPDILRKVIVRKQSQQYFTNAARRIKQILHIEPNQMDVDLTTRQLALEAPHLHLLSVATGREALALLTVGHDFDLVLTDLRVPDMNALELIREAQHRGIDTPFIVITGKGGEAMAVAILRLGAYDYLVKRKDYLVQLPYAIDNALHRYYLNMTSHRLNGELSALNVTLEQKIEERTRQFKQEMELRLASQASYQHLIEHTHDLVQRVDANGKLMFVNSAWSAALGWTHEEAMELHYHQLVRFDLLEYCDGLFAELKQGKNFSEIEVVFVAKDGHEVILEGNLTSIFVGDKFSGTQSFFHDITLRKKVETELALSAQVFDKSGEAFLITDASGNIIKVNHAFTVISGYSEADVLGKNPRILSSGRQGQKFYRAMWESINTLGFWQGELIDRRKDGSFYPKWLSISRVLDTHGNVTNYIGTFSDITQHKQDAENIQRLAYFDALTGLPNRLLLNDRISHALSMAQRSQTQLAILFMDLDHFKNVNDSLGHRVGDLLLIEVAKRLNSVIREEDTVSRLGGDEFIMVLQDSNVDGAAHVAEKIMETLSHACLIEKQELVITPSIGIAMYPTDGEDIDTLSKCADVAMYRAKRNGRNNYCFFTKEMQEHSVRRLKLENALHHAIERGQLTLHYQPQISLVSGKIVGAEALLRWSSPEFGDIAPAEFIPIAESSGLILPVGEWVLNSSIRQMKAWIDKGLTPMTIAVNLSAVQFRHANLLGMVTSILESVKLDPKHLELELTEGVAMDDPLGAIAVMDSLNEQGIRMSIDDFGTGYSSLSYLKRFQVYKLKIDQSFVGDITIDPEDRAIVAAIINMADSLELETIAEGVETAGQLAYLQEKQCDEVQGYYFSKPLPAEQFEKFVREWDGIHSPK